MPRPGHFIALSGNQTGGRLLRWYRDELGAAERAIAAESGRDVYDVIVEQIDDAPGEYDPICPTLWAAAPCS